MIGVLAMPAQLAKTGHGDGSEPLNSSAPVPNDSRAAVVTRVMAAASARRFQLVRVPYHRHLQSLVGSGVAMPTCNRGNVRTTVSRGGTS